MSQEATDEKQSPTGRRERNVEARRQQILQAARVLLSRGGLGALSMRKLAEEASLSVNTLYNLWGTREEILRATSDELSGGSKTGLAPYERDSVLCFQSTNLFAYSALPARK